VPAFALPRFGVAGLRVFVTFVVKDQ